MVMTDMFQLNNQQLPQLQIPDPPEFSPPNVSQSATNFITIQSDVRAGAIRVEISDPEQCHLEM